MSIVFTVAIGDSKYFRMAISLARSFLFHNKSPNLTFVIFTDRDRKLSIDLKNINIKIVPSEFVKPGLEFKLNFDQFLPHEHCLFIDCDCFILGDLSPVFERFKGSSIGVIGVSVNSGEWCGAKIENVLDITKHISLTRFNGGLYYINNLSCELSLVFESARSWVHRYDSLGFSRLGKHLNDEPLMSLALADHAIRELQDDGSILADLNFARGSRLDVLEEGAFFINHSEGHAGRKWWYKTEIVRPVIVHYGSGGFGRYVYLRESLKLYLVQRLGIPVKYTNYIFDHLIRNMYLFCKGRNGTTL